MKGGRNEHVFDGEGKSRERLRLVGLRNGEKFDTLNECTEVLFGEVPVSPPPGLGHNNDRASESYSDEEPEFRVGGIDLLQHFRHDRECDLTQTQ